MLFARLRREVGSGRDNDPRDILGLKQAFAALGRIGRPEGGFTEIIDKPLADAIEGFQMDKGLLLDGMLTPGGETERNIRRDLGGGPKEKPFDMRSLNLSGPVGNVRDNPERDVQAVSRALGQLGLFTFDRTSEPPPLITKGLDDAIQAFQRRAGLRVDGNVNPGGETVRALATAVNGADDDTPEIPDTPEPEKPEKPEKPEESPCEDFKDELRQVYDDLVAIRQEITPTLQRINALKDEIASLRKGDDIRFSPPDRLPGGGAPPKPGSALRSILRIGGRVAPIIAALVAGAEKLNRAQLIAAAERELAALEEKLQDLERQEGNLERTAVAYEKRLAECMKGNKDPDRGP